MALAIVYDAQGEDKTCVENKLLGVSEMTALINYWRTNPSPTAGFDPFLVNGNRPSDQIAFYPSRLQQSDISNIPASHSGLDFLLPGSLVQTMRSTGYADPRPKALNSDVFGSGLYGKAFSNQTLERRRARPTRLQGSFSF